MKLALVTCAQLPDWEVDDRPFEEALRARGVEFEPCVWDEPSVAWGDYAAALIRTPWDYSEKRQAFAEWLGEVARHTVLWNPPALALWNLDKRYLRDCEQAGFRIAPSFWIGDRGFDLEACLGGQAWQLAFLKPVIGASAIDTLRFGVDEAGLSAAREHLEGLLEDTPFVLQPYLSSVETEGELSAIYFENVFSHGVRKVPVPGDYRTQDDHGASDMPHHFEKAELDVAERILHFVRERFELDSLLYARVDWLRDDDGELVINELELLEPSLFFRHGPGSAERFADCVAQRLARLASR
jgi:hypothetical protein